MTFSKNGRLGCDRLSAQDRPTLCQTPVRCGFENHGDKPFLPVLKCAPIL